MDALGRTPVQDVDDLSASVVRPENGLCPASAAEGADVRIFRALARAFTAFGWVPAPPAAPHDLGTVIPLPRSLDGRHDTPSVPLSQREREAFRRIEEG